MTTQNRQKSNAKNNKNKQNYQQWQTVYLFHIATFLLLFMMFRTVLGSYPTCSFSLFLRQFLHVLFPSPLYMDRHQVHVHLRHCHFYVILCQPILPNIQDLLEAQTHSYFNASESSNFIVTVLMFRRRILKFTTLSLTLLLQTTSIKQFHYKCFLHIFLST